MKNKQLFYPASYDLSVFGLCFCVSKQLFDQYQPVCHFNLNLKMFFLFSNCKIEVWCRLLHNSLFYVSDCVILIWKTLNIKIIHPYCLCLHPGNYYGTPKPPAEPSPVQPDLVDQVLFDEEFDTEVQRKRTTSVSKMDRMDSTAPEEEEEEERPPMVNGVGGEKPICLLLFYSFCNSCSSFY